MLIFYAHSEHIKSVQGDRVFVSFFCIFIWCFFKVIFVVKDNLSDCYLRTNLLTYFIFSFSSTLTYFRRKLPFSLCLTEHMHLFKSFPYPNFKIRINISDVLRACSLQSARRKHAVSYNSEPRRARLSNWLSNAIVYIFTTLITWLNNNLSFFVTFVYLLRNT